LKDGLPFHGQLMESRIIRDLAKYLEQYDMHLVFDNRVIEVRVRGALDYTNNEGMTWYVDREMNDKLASYSIHAARKRTDQKLEQLKQLLSTFDQRAEKARAVLL
jgi:S-adenosylmethionine:tRNA-ribosyltransferase-isomerase (queuine synthetase)